MSQKVKAEISLTLKTMNFDVKPNKNKEVMIAFTALWGKSGVKYAFMVENIFTNNIIKTQPFKNTLNFCKANGLKLIVIANKVSKVEKYCEDIQDDWTDQQIKEFIKDRDFKVIPYNKWAKFKKDFTKIMQSPEFTKLTELTKKQ